MALLQVTVNLGSAALPNTLANKRKIFVMAGRTTRNPGYGNIPYTVPRVGQHRFNLNNPSIPGAISVTAHAPVRFDSADLTDQPELLGQIAALIEKGLVTVVELGVGTPLTRTDLATYV